MKKILIIVDVELNQDLMIQLLEDEYDVITAFDGAEGVKFSLSERPDLIFMDLSLPDVDGSVAARQIKSFHELAQVPIIALTTHATSADLEKARAAGCVDDLSKPIDDGLLRAKLAKYLG